MLDRFPLHLFQELLFAWYEKNKRDLPWRVSGFRDMVHGSRLLRDPYKILVSELMLQQTQVTRVIPKFEKFIKRWPTIESLAQAKLSEVITAWRGLGYNRRAKYLLETAKLVTYSPGGKFPRETQSLKKLPGFGPYMVSAIRVFAFGEQDAVIDVNIARVFTRVESGELRMENVRQKELRELAEQSIPKGKADEWHQALMDFGSSVCTARNPKCSSCPLSRICRANRLAETNGFPSFADWLVLQPKTRKVSKKDAGKKFEETDRYFRGRIIDFLRAGEKPMEEVSNHILSTHKLVDRKRFGSIVESLVIDGLICVRGNTASLA